METQDPVVHEENKLPEVNLDLILDVELPVTVRFGQKEMILEEVLRLGEGSLIELDRMADDPVEVLINGKPLAKGEVVTVDGHFAIRITQMESQADCLRSLAN
ncbi:MAG: flagellar motor switch protein FliN [Terriglobia bacterium]